MDSRDPTSPRAMRPSLTEGERQKRYCQCSPPFTPTVSHDRGWPSPVRYLPIFLNQDDKRSWLFPSRQMVLDPSHCFTKRGSPDKAPPLDKAPPPPRHVPAPPPRAHRGHGGQPRRERQRFARPRLDGRVRRLKSLARRITRPRVVVLGNAERVGGLGEGGGERDGGNHRPRCGVRRLASVNGTRGEARVAKGLGAIGVVRHGGGEGGGHFPGGEIYVGAAKSGWGE